jgi:hypothetical protein
MSEVSNRYLALELAVRMGGQGGDGTGAVSAAHRFFEFLEGAAPTGEASAALSGKKERKSRAAPAEGVQKTAGAGAAAEDELFGSANTATPPKTGAANKSAPETASPSEDDDLFGEKAAPAKETPKATIEQLRKALTECQTKHGHKDHALGVLKKFTRDGNPTISTLDEAEYQAVIDACASYVPAK